MTQHVELSETFGTSALETLWLCESKQLSVCRKYDVQYVYTYILFGCMHSSIVTMFGRLFSAASFESERKHRNTLDLVSVVLR